MGGRGSSSHIQRKHSSQMSHVSDAKSLQDMYGYMKNTYNVTLGIASLSKSDFEAVKEAIQSVEDVLKEFPQAQKALQTVDGGNYGGGTLAKATFQGYIRINNDYYDDKSRVDRTYAASVRSGYHPAGTTAKDITAHEMGHILERALISKDVFSQGDYSVVRMKEAGGYWNKCTYASKVINEAVKAVKKTPEGKGKLTKDLIAGVSGYAKQNRSETLAECVADYHANGSRANLLSVAVWNILKRELG